jgi:uncharacterized protein with FMN-binding domain
MEQIEGKYMNKFWLKMINLLLVVGLLFGYNGILEQRTQAEEIDRLQAELETEKNREEYYRLASVSNEQQSVETTDESNNVSEQEMSVYQDGTYKGSAEGYGGLITVQATIESDTITDIAILSAPNEDRTYLEMASTIVNDILKKQTVQVDTVSGATFSSAGIRGAVSNALNKAENK